MEYIRLKDGTKIEIIGATSNSLTFDTTEKSHTEIVTLLTEKNLELFDIVNEAGESLHVYRDKKVQYPYEVNDKFVTVNLVDVNLLEKRINALEETVDTLVMESLGV